MATASTSSSHDPRATAQALRAMGVTFGPSFVADGLLAVSTGITLARSALRRDRSSLLRLVGRMAAFGALLPWVYVLAVRPWLLRWGATEEELASALPGDEIVPHATLETTRAVTIHAPPAAVWPWLAQIGQGRGGLYSYDWLENLAGLDIHSADRILPEHQQLREGDRLYLDSNRGQGMRVVRAQPPQALVLHVAMDPITGAPVDPGTTPARLLDWTWAFILRPVEPASTRLLIRARARFRPSRAGALVSALLLEFPWFVMERKMLLGIKARAERNRRATSAV